MFIQLRDIPQYERHLLFCTDPRLDGRPRNRRRRARRRARVSGPPAALKDNLPLPVAAA